MSSRLSMLVLSHVGMCMQSSAIEIPLGPCELLSVDRAVTSRHATIMVSCIPARQNFLASMRQERKRSLLPQACNLTSVAKMSTGNTPQQQPVCIQATIAFDLRQRFYNLICTSAQTRTPTEMEFTIKPAKKRSTVKATSQRSTSASSPIALVCRLTARAASAFSK